jgi:hypothetical protein
MILEPGYGESAARGSIEEFLQDRGGSLGYRLIGEEIRAYPQGVGRGSHSSHSCEKTKIVNVTCPGCERLHREDMLGEAAITRSPGWSNTRRFPGSSFPEM